MKKKKDYDYENIIIVCRCIIEFYKQLHIALQVLKIFQF